MYLTTAIKRLPQILRKPFYEYYGVLTGSGVDVSGTGVLLGTIVGGTGVFVETTVAGTGVFVGTLRVGCAVSVTTGVGLAGTAVDEAAAPGMTTASNVPLAFTNTSWI